MGRFCYLLYGIYSESCTRLYVRRFICIYVYIFFKVLYILGNKSLAVIRIREFTVREEVELL